MSSTKAARRPAAASMVARLTFGYTASAFGLVFAAAAFLYGALWSSLNRENAEALADHVGILRQMLRDHPGDLGLLREEVEVESSARQHPRIFLRVLSADGRILTETPGMSQEVPPEAYASSPGASERAERFHRPGRKPFAILTSSAPGHVLHAALDVSRGDQMLRGFRSSMFALLGVTLGLSAIVGHRIARRGIRPVEEIARTAQKIRSSTLDERIEISGLPAEIAALGSTFNEMLSRLEEAFARLARFSADIAHELRTPINTLRGEAEVALGKARSPEEYREILGSSLEEYARLTRLIESLLFLARAEDPGTQIQKETVDLSRELSAVREFYEPAAGERGVQIELEAPPGLEAGLDRTLFQRAAGNLVENALAHTPSGGRITLSAHRHNGSVQVEVADTGCGIPAEHLPHVFDRLYRVDRSRTAATGGAGLGLAIVKSIAELHGGTAAIASEPGKGTRVTLVFPASAARV